MPVYCFSTESGEVTERQYPRDRVPEAIVVLTKDGKWVEYANRDYRAENVRGSIGAGRTKLSGWPQTCFASGVNANQADELRDHLARRGCPTEVTEKGDVVYTSAAHKRKALKVRGICDKSAFC